MTTVATLPSSTTEQSEPTVEERVQEMRATQAVADRAAAALDELGQIDADREIEVQA